MISSVACADADPTVIILHCTSARPVRVDAITQLSYLFLNDCRGCSMEAPRSRDKARKKALVIGGESQR
jgi:hypothetical protein